MRRSLALPLTLASAALLLVAGIEIILITTGPPELVVVGTVYAVVGVVYVGVGALTWARRPANRTGGLLVLCGLAVLVSGLGNCPSPVLLGIGYVTAQGQIGVLVHLVLAFPSGRLGDRWSRLLAVGGYVITLVLPAPIYLFSADPAVPGWLHLSVQPGVVAVADVVQRVAAVAVIAAVAVVCGLRLRAVRRTRAAVLGAVSAYGVGTLLFLDLSANLARIVGIGVIPLFVAQVVVFAGVPIVFALAIIRGGLAVAGGVEGLTAWLGAAHDRRVTLRAALAYALGDPSVEVLFWLPDVEGYVDAEGVAANPRTGPRRARIEVDLAGERLGMIGYDADLTADPEQVRAMGRVAALAVDRERLVAELLAGRAALRESRARIVEAGDRERRRVARDLHDGLQSRLVVLAVRAGQLAAASTDLPGVAAETRALRSDAEASIATLREVVHGIIPALLVDQGLYPAVEELVDRLPVVVGVELPDHPRRLPAPIESAAYFTVAELVTNAVKHARAGRLQVRLRHTDARLVVEVHDDGIGGADVRHGGGLRGVADRIEAVGGTLRVHSPPGGGTSVVAEVPCGS